MVEGRDPASAGADHMASQPAIGGVRRGFGGTERERAGKGLWMATFLSVIMVAAAAHWRVTAAAGDLADGEAMCRRIALRGDNTILIFLSTTSVVAWAKSCGKKKGMDILISM